MEVDPQRVRHLLRRALRRPPAERRSFLVDACGGDLDLLAATRQALAREEDAPATATVEPSETEQDSDPSTDATEPRSGSGSTPSAVDGAASVEAPTGATATLEPADRVDLARVLDTAVSWADYQAELGPRTPAPPPGTGPTETFQPDELRRRAALLETIDPVAAAELTPGRAQAAEERTRLPTLADDPGNVKPADHPRWIGPYKLLELLGEGGMGSVYLAEQRRPLRRRVALKLMQTGRMSPTARARFDAERQALARLDHPAIGRILDAGATDDGELFFAMERVVGERITNYCDRHRLTIEQRVTLMAEVCRGVEHAHRKQILHRDIKPSNILVTEVDGRPAPKIIDFGIAKALDQPLTERTLVTAGWILGTPVYMSPEALEGQGDVDTRSDVYALGMVLYEVLAGERPFEIQDSGLSQILKYVLESDPPRPSDRFATVARQTRTEVAAQRNVSPPELRRRLAGDLDWIVLRCLAKDRDERYGSAAELAEDLERHLRFEPVNAGPPGLGYRLGKFARRHRGALTMTALLLLLVVVAGVLQVRSRWRADRMAQAGQTMTREVERIEWLLRVTHQLPPQSVVRDRHRIRQAMGRIEQQMEDLGHLGVGPGSYALGRGALALGDLEAARHHLERARDEGYRPAEVAFAFGLTLGGLYEQRLEAIQRLPDPRIRQEQREAAAAELRDPALEQLALGRESTIATPALLDARIALYQGRYDDAVTAAELAIQQRPWLWESHLLRSRALERQAGEVRESNDLDHTFELLEAAEDAVHEALAVGRSDPAAHLRLCSLRVGQLSLTSTYQRPGIDTLHAEALAACETTRTIDPTLLQVDLEESIAWLDLAYVQVWDRQEDPAESIEEARLRLRRLLAEHPDHEEAHRLLGNAWGSIANHLMRSGEDPFEAFDESLRWLDRALALAPGLRFIHLDMVDKLATRAVLRSNRGESPEADVEKILEHVAAVEVESPDEVRMHFSLARAMISLGSHQSEHGLDPIASLERAGEAMRRCQEIDPNMNQVPNTLAYVDLLAGKWLLKSGGDPGPRFEQAAEWARQASERLPNAPFPRFTAGQIAMNRANHALAVGQDPTPHIEFSRSSYARGHEALPRLTGTHAELAELALVESRHRLRRGQSPVAAVAEAERRAAIALEIDASRADAHRAAGLARVVEARWQRRRGDDGEGALGRASKALAQALELSEEAETHTALARLALARAGGFDVSRPVSGETGAVARGLHHAHESLRLDPSRVEALALEGALLTLDPTRRDEGRRKIEEAIARNANLEVEWREWLEDQP